MRRSFAAACALLALTGGAVGCRGAESRADGSSRDCVRQWNEPANARNRRLAVGGGDDWRVEVSRWRVDHPGPAFTGQGCAYFLFTDERWMSISNAWMRDGTIRWNLPPTQRGARRPEQRIGKPNARLEADGTLARR